MSDLLLPPPLAADDRYQVLGAIAAARLSDIDITPVLVYLIDTVDTTALPVLADQFHILGEGWQFARTEAEQRQLLKRAIELHRYKGTPWAIQQVLDTLQLSGKVSEWFDYGGQPYHFKISVDVTSRGIDANTLSMLTALVNEYKNVRSHLELVSLSQSSEGAVYYGVAVQLSSIVEIYPYQQTELQVSDPLFYAATAHWVATMTVYPELLIADGSWIANGTEIANGLKQHSTMGDI